MTPWFYIETEVLKLHNFTLITFKKKKDKTTNKKNNSLLELGSIVSKEFPKKNLQKHSRHTNDIECFIMPGPTRREGKHAILLYRQRILNKSTM